MRRGFGADWVLGRSCRRSKARNDCDIAWEQEFGVTNAHYQSGHAVMGNNRQNIQRKISSV